MQYLYCDYDEGDSSTYRAFFLDARKKGPRFASGDPVKDCRDAIEYAHAKGESVVFTSSVDGFLMDQKRDVFMYDRNHFIVRKTKRLKELTEAYWDGYFKHEQEMERHAKLKAERE